MASKITEKDVLTALSAIQDPDLHKDIVTLGFVKNIKIQDSQVSLDIVLTTPACPVKDQMREEANKILSGLPGISSVEVNMTSNVTKGASNVKQDLIPQVKNTIAISSGKGGVGKSTVAATLAVALAQTGAKVGLLDADVYGPNIPMMMGLNKPPQQRDDKLIPAESHGVHLMSMGFLVNEDEPIIWRGPMIHGAIQQFLRDVAWGELDYLIVDLPPGTGDAQLSIVQLVPLTGAIIVTTPQAVALHDSKKGLAMFQRVNVPLLGIIENMSYFLCPHCNERTEIFSHGGGKKAAEKLAVPFLGEIPIDPAVREGGDNGTPILISHPDSAVSEAYRKIAGSVAAQISILNDKRQTLKIINQ
jgi:ATP-binding protein involved in chromosome partitioning